MGLGRQGDRQGELLLSWQELPRSQGHPFYDKLQDVLRDSGFDRHVEGCARRTIQPRRKVGDRCRRGATFGRRWSVILRGSQHRRPTDLIRLDRHRAGKKLSNEDWESPTDTDARIAQLKNGRTRLAYKPEHAVDLDTGAILAAPVHHADRGDTKTLNAVGLPVIRSASSPAASGHPRWVCPVFDPESLAGCFADIGQTVSTHRAEPRPWLALAAVKVSVQDLGKWIWRPYRVAERFRDLCCCQTQRIP